VGALRQLKVEMVARMQQLQAQIFDAVQAAVYSPAAHDLSADEDSRPASHSASAGCCCNTGPAKPNTGFPSAIDIIDAG
jgi:hypothetical protein